ncbi:NAD(P)H-binding protein [Aurantiacibacter marinus]|uniref:NAD(P)-binding domain-containing protein n=1 Tax=Aurantiacibacter marinus TaxID=874156 RepID=A0A0H0XSD1_9SPHN|nr:NAD(P)H-binding protein [Aurantiacibacter marinus]KLI63220.1 hypothetical protein AAV99_11120 [Aurantiacibacter marinus]
MSDAETGKRRVLLVGATGLIGRSIIARTAGLTHIALQGLARREMTFPEGARMELVLADTPDWGGVVEALKPDAVICALGTTRAKAGSVEAMRAVDYELVMQVARAAKDAGARSFVHVSSVGADTASRSLYLRTKGEVERDLKSLRFKRLDILRPGLLLGKREADLRFLEGIGRMLAPLTDIFLQGDVARYRSIKASIVAAAALQCTGEKAGGQFVHEHDGLNRLAGRFEGVTT